MRIECAPGSHTITFAYKEEGNVIASKSLVVTVISGRETTISGKIDRNETSTGISAPTSETKPVEVKQNEATTVSVNVAPANTSSISNQTTVTFPQGSLPEEATNAVLNLSVKPADSEFSVSAVGQSNAVAGISISLVVNDQEVTTFNDKEVEIETFIAKGLTGVGVYYNGQPLDSSDYEYNSGDGKLTIKTKHFSEFYVGTTSEAVNVTTNKGYASLAEAIKSSQNGDVVTLIADAEMLNSLIIDGGMQITIDLNNHDISAPSSVIKIVHANVTLTGTGTIYELNDNEYGAVLLYGAATDKGANYSVVTVDENVTLRGWSGIFVSIDEAGTYKNYGIVANIKGKIVLPGMDNHKTRDGAGIYINGQNNNIEGNVPVFNLDGAEITGNTGIYAAGYAKWNLNNVKIDAESEALSIKAGKFEIDDGTYKAKGKFADPSEDTSNGSVETGAALSMTSNDSYAHKIDVTVKNGTFESLNGYSVYEGIPNKEGTSNPAASESYVTLNITGGKFVGNSERGAIKISKMTNKKVVTGGIFSDNPSSYLAQYYGVIKKDNMYIVTKLIESNGVYLIKNADELILFANMVNECGNSFSGKIVKLEDNIDLSGINWTPIGQTGATQFMGTFDGNNHTILNLNIDNGSASSNCATGLFGWLNSATVKNLTIDGANVTGHHNVGVISGYMETSGCTIENCHVKNATVSCTSVNSDANGDKCGGIVGHAGNAGVVVNGCTVTNSTISAGRDAGQVVGAALIANISGCSATNVTVTANGTSTGANIRNEVIGRVL